jgi:hypothetical protein
MEVKTRNTVGGSGGISGGAGASGNMNSGFNFNSNIQAPTVSVEVSPPTVNANLNAGGNIHGSGFYSI